MNRFGEKLRTLRKQQGLTVRELAPILGIKSFSYLSDLENGKKTPSLELAIKVSDLFGVTIDQLVRDELDIV